MNVLWFIRVDDVVGSPAWLVVASDAGPSKGDVHGRTGVRPAGGKMEAYLKEMGMTGLSSARGTGRRRPI